jgi:hypothetical protein
VLTGDLGLDASKVTELREAGAIGSPVAHELAETAAGDD